LKLVRKECQRVPLTHATAILALKIVKIVNVLRISLLRAVLDKSVCEI